MITETMSLSHVKWDCKYHVVITPKYRKKILYGQIRKRIGEIFRELSAQKSVQILEGNACLDHIHMVMSIPPKYSVAMIMGFIKGKSAIKVHQEFSKYQRSYYGKNFWSRGYYVSTVGIEEEKIKRYVRDQEQKDKKLEGSQLDMGW